MRNNESLVSPVVEAWATYRTTSAADWPTRRLLRAKGDSRVSVVLPARNEEATVGAIVATIREHLMDRVSLVDELIVVDSRSTDRTAAVARAAGAEVVGQDAMTRGLPRLTGKGDALWAGLAAAEGDVVAFVDADLREFRPHFVTGLLGPLLTDPSVDFVKGFYHRPLVSSGGVEADGGGRVTELMARPMLNLFWPELAGFVQPLAGEYAGRREVLSRVPFVSGYGVETAMLIDLLELVGLDALAQVDLGERKHRHQDTAALGRMSAQIMLTAWSRLQRRGWANSDVLPTALLTQFRRGGSDALPNLDREIVVSDVAVEERPPLAELQHQLPRRQVAAA
ncbi:glucosyl-3-phosphoglycerate synthase [Micromonospora sediminimaris]|uniref:Glucosyl-3-phosphoglycerate synthase n=1 Tax=Micromonospora sediminimaris TaxID=547162 RepID=A0A9W5XHP0_9ACTN|nr:glucosyl-3-phosphoglycerate synthase [Micromonospora sediminimaris]SFC44370.1 glucosyl-3-phosphoglycerate synthase [Micromonospora sediminimaris]